MFEVNLVHGAADRLRRTLLALSPSTDAKIRCLPYAIVVDISPDEVELVLYKRRRHPESRIVSALLRMISVMATRTEVKFSAANEEVIPRTQPGANLDIADCIIDDFPDADEVSFSFSLRNRQMIINTCELTEIVRLLHSDGLKPMLSCAVGGLGRLVLFFDWPC